MAEQTKNPMQGWSGRVARARRRNNEFNDPKVKAIREARREGLAATAALDAFREELAALADKRGVHITVVIAEIEALAGGEQPQDGEQGGGDDENAGTEDGDTPGDGVEDGDGGEQPPEYGPHPEMTREQIVAWANARGIELSAEEQKLRKAELIDLVSARASEGQA